MFNNSRIPTRRSYPSQTGHCIDAVFGRYVSILSCGVLVWYFTHQKPILCTMKNQDTVNIIELENKSSTNVNNQVINEIMEEKWFW